MRRIVPSNERSLIKEFVLNKCRRAELRLLYGALFRAGRGYLFHFSAQVVSNSNGYPNPTLEGVKLCDGNTLNNDFAYDWYNHGILAGANEANTHQLAGTFDSYASFQQVRARGHDATNDEVHNIVEGIVGAEYGMQAGIYWGYAYLARSEFVKACNGYQLGYAEHRPNWTAASVYRSPEGKVQAFARRFGTASRTTTYRFLSKDRDVYYEGYGPQCEYTLELPGGTGYQQGQTNAERVVSITWGDDIQPVIDGRYVW